MHTQRCGFEWQDGTEKTMLKAFRKRNLGSPEATWYLFQVAIIPECQGKGERFIDFLIGHHMTDNMTDCPLKGT